MTICSICGDEEEFMIYEIINLVRGGEAVGNICTDCAKKASLDKHTKGR